jgi:hypothetical protein
MPQSAEEITIEHLHFLLKAFSLSEIAQQTGLHYNTVSNHKTGVRPIGKKDKVRYFNLMKEKNLC